ncbi:TonB-dependent receptor plug domain-containing protein [Sphingorhabdus sp. 109]|jgi:iron complex outermembrane receptor protein|uniref:TonB-dependent receptor plug domain-containing protein n=1 Tax=Sphingorhabdus sp. 109 TaxID=2653173 RepID=UPI0012EF578B|nr:TonB-dependent receptor [Sphingorhabdus sp. 109]VWX56461.1 Ligand-gated channel [Sphingorhabdus sp. 109]
MTRSLLHWRLIATAVPIVLAAPAFAQDSPAADHPEANHADDHHSGEAEQVIIVQGTRNRRRVQDEPIRVEVIVGEEIEEKAIMRPGNIAMLVAETGGVRVQVTSPALGAANIRIQGLEGRYTQLLADGLPLYGGQAASLGLLQIPPTDLGQVEIIKGAASALYGPSALGGVINLISKNPGDAFEAEILANATTRDGQDLTGYISAPLSDSLGVSLTAGAHRQTGQDIDGDGWYDIASYDRFTARPRFQWDDGSGSSLYLTLGAMTEERVGGTLTGQTVPDGTFFPQTQDTERFDAGLVGETPIDDSMILHFRASAMQQDHLHRFGTTLEDDRHQSVFAEASVSGGSGATTWVGGIAFQSDAFRSESFPAFNYSYDVPGIFAQVEHEISAELTLAGSGRVDFHDEFGTQFSPRLSALYRPGNWTIRGSLGGGFFAPNPFVDEIEAAGLSQLEPLGDLEAETAATASLDVGYASGPFEASVTLFGADIDNATRLQEIAPDRVRLVNVDGTTKVRGSELLVRYKQNGFTVTGSYVYVDATEPDASGLGRREVPLTPRHTAGLVGMWEEHGKGRIGVEAYYTGAQSLEDNPFRTRSRPYVHLGILGEIVLGRISLFANAENLLNVRQTRYDPLLRPQRDASGQWTVDAWAPLDGFTLNGGIRLRFGGE